MAKKAKAAETAPVAGNTSALEVALESMAAIGPRRIVAVESPVRGRIFVHDGVQHEYVGDDAQGRRIYRNQSR